MAKDKNSKIFYGYVIVAISTLILIVMHGVGGTYGIFFKYLQQEFSANRATISGANSVAFFLEGLFAIFFGRLTDRFGPRKVITAAALVFGGGFFLMSRVDSIWQLYLFYGIAVGMGVSSGNVALLSTTARWFTRRRGLMSSIVKVGTGGGIFITPIIVVWLITSYGWRDAYLYVGLVGMVLIILLAQFLKSDPAQMKLKPYGEGEGEAGSAGSAMNNSVVQLSSREALRTRQLWIIAASYFVAWYVTQSIMVHSVSYAIDGGISAGSAALIISIIGGVSMAGRLAMGGAGDKIGNKRALIICFAILVVSLIWLQFAKQLWMMYLFAVVYGFAHGGFFAVMSPLIAEIFGTKYLGANFGLTLFLGQTGGAIGPLVTGRIFDITNNYQLAFLLLIAIAISGMVMAGVLRPIKTKGQA